MVFQGIFSNYGKEELFDSCILLYFLEMNKLIKKTILENNRIYNNTA